MDAAFGIVIAEGFAWEAVLQLIAKKATVYIGDREEVHTTPDAILEAYSKFDMTQEAFIFECYPDVVQYGATSIENRGDLFSWEKNNDNLATIDGIKLISCNNLLMLYIACLRSNATNFQPAIAELQKVQDLFERLKAEGRITDRAYIGIQRVYPNYF
jgi:hypothetical protein